MHRLQQRRVVVGQREVVVGVHVKGVVHSVVGGVMAQCRDQQCKLVHDREALADLAAFGHSPVAALEDTEAVPHVVVGDLVVLREDFGREGRHDLLRELAALFPTTRYVITM